MSLATADAPVPPGCTPLFAAAATRAADAAATERFGIPSVLLMERAGLESARRILSAYPVLRRAVVLVGGGNNGGDGMVVARHLTDAGWTVDVRTMDGADPRTPDAACMAAITRAIGVAVRPVDPLPPPDAGAVLVDALLGTGTAGAPRPPMDAVVEWAAHWPGPVVALDVPTGVDGDTGEVPGPAVRAHLTLTYHGDKPGLRIAPGRARAGRVEVVDIGIPAAVALPPTAWLAHAGAAASIPAKAADGEKYGAGAVLVVAGAPGMSGAGVLCATAALRTGAGLVVAAVPASVHPLMAPGMPEVMCVPVPAGPEGLDTSSVDAVTAQSGRVDAVALGPGLGRGQDTTAAVMRLLGELRMPVVLDADGLWHLGRADRLGAVRDAPTVLTPHTGEAARLLGRTRSEVERTRLRCARELAAVSRAVVVLKGPGTVVADPSGGVTVAAGGTPALSTAGSGDVLTGVIAAALAKGLGLRDAAVAAVALHAVAGEAAGTGDGTIAGDLVRALPGALDGLRGSAA